MAKSDKKVEELQKIVAAKKAEISKADKPSYKTNMAFRDAQGSTVNLNTVTNVNQLVGIAGYILGKQHNYFVGATNLGLTIDSYDYNGYSVDDWLHDLKARVAKIQIANEKAKLEKLEIQLHSLLSQDAKVSKELKAIEDLLA